MEAIIIDGLEWQAKDDGNRRSLRDSIIYATTLGDGWRLPTIEELISIIDFTTHGPACKIKPCRSSYYWSNSPYANNSSTAWGVNFFNGYVYGNYKDFRYYARCVRKLRAIQQGGC